MHPIRALLRRAFPGFFCVLITTEVSGNYRWKSVGLPPGLDLVRTRYIVFIALPVCDPYLHIAKRGANSSQLVSVGVKYHIRELEYQTNEHGGATPSN